MPPKIWRLPSPPTPLQNTTESPTSPNSPLSPSFSNPIPSSSSPHSNSTNTTTTHTNLTPPPRLHLRTLISSYLTPASTPTPTPIPPPPPIPPPISNPPLPSIPYPWLWKCHLCASVYRLGVTRRCLEDGHFFCAVVSPPVSPTSPTLPPLLPSPPAVSSSEISPSEKGIEEEESDEVKAKKDAKAKARRRREKRREKKRRKGKGKGNGRGKGRGRGCRAEFDYGGWKGWNLWRREVVRLRVENEEVRRGRVLMRSPGEGSEDDGSADGKGRVGCPEVYIEEERKGGGEVYSLGGNESCGDGEMEKRDRSKGRSRNRDQRENWGGGEGVGKRGGNCWLDCDFPSECHNERKAEREWQERLLEMRRLDAEWMERERDRSLNITLGEELGTASGESMDLDEDECDGRKRRKSSGDLGEDHEVFMAGVGEWDEDEDGDTIMSDAEMDFESEDDANAWAGFDPVSGAKISSYSQSHDIPIGLAITADATTYPSIQGEERDINFTASRSETGLENLGPIGVDSDGLGEAGYQLTYTRSIRRKSVEGLHGESPPSSPLKECSFGFADLVGGDLGVKSARESSAEDEHHIWKDV